MKKYFTLALSLMVMCMFIACGGEKKVEEKPAVETETQMATSGMGGYVVTDVMNGGTITGKVTFAGMIPQKKKLEVTKDMNACGKAEHYDESVVVSSDKGLANVVVKLTNISAGKAYPEGIYQIDQRGCAFLPHIAFVPVGSAITIINSDGILHNIHTYSEVNPAINVAQPGFKKSMTQTFEKAEVIRIACDVHNWMSGYIVVMDNPYYAVTDANGNFEISGVPAGTYTLEYWQETLGTQTAQVTVAAGSAVMANAEFAAGS